MKAKQKFEKRLAISGKRANVELRFNFANEELEQQEIILEGERKEMIESSEWHYQKVQFKLRKITDRIEYIKVLKKVIKDTKTAL